MINLNDCVKGQKLRLRDGMIVSYVDREPSRSYPHDVRTEDGDYLSYTDEGIYHTSGYRSHLNVVDMLPLETTDSNKSDKHPSIAWWESCPWIINRKPTEEDSDEWGCVMIKPIDRSSGSKTYWLNVKVGDPWVHCSRWQPPALTDRDQALQLINNHEDGWRPTPEQWNVIRKGLEAS